MKTLKFAFLCLATSLFLFTGCLENRGNYQKFSHVNSVVTSFSEFPGMTFLYTSAYFEAVAVPELNDAGYKNGDCLISSFTLDYDNQPTGKYATATEVVERKLGQADILMLDAADQTDIQHTIDLLSVDSIQSVVLLGSNPCIANKLFMGFSQNDYRTQNYEYQLVYSDLLIDDIPVLYVCAKKSDTASGILIDNHLCQAFDLSSFLSKYTDDENNRFSFYLKYKRNVDEDGKNLYHSFLIENMPNLK